jgi:predicted glutamine amidotransferase
MCGHAGFARHPEGKGLKRAVNINRALTVAAQARGKHATGFAVLGPTESFVRKWAMSMDAAMESGIYAGQVEEKIPSDVLYVMSHTRYATLPNKGDDAAAHPYIMNRTIGCHNGQIKNWKELAKTNEQDDWLTDSQAAIWMIDQMDDPADALMTLDGWWALAWVKGGVLHLTRTTERPMAVAYVPKLKTLFWASEESDLKEVLKKARLKFKSWPLKADTLYRFDPAKFNSKANAERTALTLNRPSKHLATKAADGRSGWNYPVRDYRAVPAGPSKQLEFGKPLGVKREQRDGGLKEFMDDVDRKIQEMDGRLESAEAEIGFLYDVIDRMGGLTAEGEGDVCNECGEPGDNMLRLPDGGAVHAKCVLT